MIVVLALIGGASGLLLSGVRQETKERRKLQILTYVQGPAIKSVLAGAENDPILDRKEIKLEATKGPLVLDIFPAKREGRLWAVALETKGKGYGGDLGVIVGIDIKSNSLIGIGITTHKETPGLGARVSEEGFQNEFKDISLDTEAKVTADGGSVDAISGATISSRGVCEAVNKGVDLFKKNRELILEELVGMR